jgi:hypothetical protein
MEDLVLDGRKEKVNATAWTGLIWLRVRTSSGLLWILWWTYGFYPLKGHCVHSVPELLRKDRAVRSQLLCTSLQFSMWDKEQTLKGAVNFIVHSKFTPTWRWHLQVLVETCRGEFGMYNTIYSALERLFFISRRNTRCLVQLSSLQFVCQVWQRVVSLCSPYDMAWRHRGGVTMQLYSFFNLSTGCEWMVYCPLCSLAPRIYPGTTVWAPWLV